MDAENVLDPNGVATSAGGAPAPGEMPPGTELPKGLDAARLEIEPRTRIYGHCLFCDEFVERNADGSCAAGHEPRFISGAVELADGEPLPKLPGFNLAAFLLPPLWGLWYGQLVGVFFVPMWIFANNALEIARGKGGAWLVISVLLMVANLFFMFIFARRANAVAYRRVCAKQSVATFRRRQMIWSIVAVAVWLAFGAWWLAFESGVRF